MLHTVQRIFSHPLESFLSHRPDKLLLRLGHLEDESDAYHWVCLVIKCDVSHKL